MELDRAESIIEAILFSAGRVVKISEIAAVIEYTEDDVDRVIQNMQTKYLENSRGIEIIKVEDGYQMSTKKEFYEYLYPIFDNRAKPSLSNAALEVLSIIAYNPRITKAEIEAIRGVNSDGTMYKLQEYNLIENVGKSDAPGRPSMYRVTNEFLKLFGLKSLDDLTELPRYKLDENKQIVIDEIIEQKENIAEESAENIEAKMPAREESTQDIEAPCPEREE